MSLRMVVGASGREMWAEESWKVCRSSGCLLTSPGYSGRLGGRARVKRDRDSCLATLSLWDIRISSGLWKWNQNGNPYYVCPRWLTGEEPSCNAGDVSSIPKSGRSLGRKWQPCRIQEPEWEVPWTEEPGVLPSRVEKSWTILSMSTCTHYVCAF